MDFDALQHSLEQKSSIAANDPRIEAHYDLVEQIGKGAYGVVWKAHKRGGDDTWFAVKQINKRRVESKSLKEVMGEVETMSMLNHPNIVRLERTFQDNDNLWIVMEYLPGGELHQMLTESVTETTAKRIITQLLLAVEYIHDRGIVHRDLKPANCLLTGDYTLKISDFGFAVLAGSEQCLTTYCGTIAFMAPEILLKKNYGKPVDMWALGVMTYFIFLGEYPFNGDCAASVTKAICKNSYNADHERLMQYPLLRDFVSRLLTPDPNKRITAKDALAHPWIKALDSTTCSRRRRGDSMGSCLPPISRFRAVVYTVMVAHRIRYFYHCRRLAKLGFGKIQLLRNFHYLVTGRFGCRRTSLSCAKMFPDKPQALLELLPMVESCPTIEHLDLSGNNIDNLGLVQSLLKMVSKHPGLLSLDLSNNPIPALAGRGLVRLARNPTCRIQQINVEGTLIGADSISQLQTALKEKAEAPPPSNPLGNHHSNSASSMEASSRHGEVTLPSSSTFASRSHSIGKRQSFATNSATKRSLTGTTSSTKLPMLSRRTASSHKDSK